MTGEMTGVLRKMQVKMPAKSRDPVRYKLPVGEKMFPVSERVGGELRIEFSGNIFCIHCGRATKKSFAQGYCYPCFRDLAECDMCIMRPENCHHHQGTCRDSEWAKGHCMQPHYVYLANSSGLKVGITRGSQVPTRWIDQGASQAIPVFRVKNRFHSGLIEVALKKQVTDRTDWRRMLKGTPDPVDLKEARREIVENARADLEALTEKYRDVGDEAIGSFEYEELDDAPIALSFPVEVYPEKVTSYNLDKTPCVEGALQGIKGQYLIFEGGALNVRKFAGYEVTVS